MLNLPGNNFHLKLLLVNWNPRITSHGDHNISLDLFNLHPANYMPETPADYSCS